MSINGTRHIAHANPCEGICTQATGDYVCRKCGRTIPEAANWNALERVERVEIRGKCKGRLDAIRNGANPGDASLWG